MLVYAFICVFCTGICVGVFFFVLLTWDIEKIVITGDSEWRLSSKLEKE